MSAKKILVTGAAGMLGSCVLEELRVLPGVSLVGAVHTHSHPVAGVPEAKVELTDQAAAAALLREVDPDVIIHCAAKVSVDACEKDKSYARALHSETSGQLAAHRGGKVDFLYVSTDSVFDGKTGGYSETDAPSPLNYYALSKREGELAVLSANPAAIVIRVNIYGFHVPPGQSLFEWCHGRLASGETVPGFEDITFNPLYTRQLARLMCGFVERGHPAGVIHAGSDRTVSKLDFLRLVAEQFGYPPGMVTAARGEFSPFETPRPKHTTLNTEILKGILGEIPSLSDGIRELHADFKEKNRGVR